VIAIIIRRLGVTVVISEIAWAEPVLVLFVKYSVTNDIAITNVFIDPNNIKNWWVDIFFTILVVRVAAWLDPSPGKKEQIGDIIIVAIVGFSNSFLGITNFVVFCFGIFVFVIIELMSVDDPNSPVSRGMNGCSRFVWNVIAPNNPERKKIVIAHVFFLWNNRKNIIHTRIHPIIFCMKGLV